MQWYTPRSPEEARRAAAEESFQRGTLESYERDCQAMQADPSPTCRTCSFSLLPKLAAARGETMLELSFFGDGPSDDDLKHLRGFRRLQKLDLSDAPNLSDAGLEALAGLTSLTELILPNASRLTLPGVAKLRAALPGCAIRGGPVPPRPWWKFW
jgi:hypothetical protein